MHSARPPSATLLALLYAVSGALCLLGAARPMSPHSPVGLLWALSAVGLVGAAAVWLVGGRMPQWAVHGALACVSVLAGLLAWRSATAVGVVGLGPALMAVGLYSAHFFPLPAARAQTAFVLAACSAGAWAAGPTGFLVEWVVVVVAVAAITEAQARYSMRLRRAATADPLTGVANRRGWEAEAQRNLAHALRTGEPLGFAILDLDDFKEVNDREGHGAGDALLRELTTAWTRRLRRADLLGRYGGDEFVLCLPGTDETGIQQILDQLDSTHAFAWTAGKAVARAGDTLATVLARADADLYLRKRAGRAL